ncbi:MAG: hypothetical protein QW116_02960 [Zestosphaera sp.]
MTSNDTITYYKSLFKKFLEGKELTEELMEEVINHENKWVRNVFRHYVQYLYCKRKISLGSFWVDDGGRPSQNIQDGREALPDIP